MSDTDRVKLWRQRMKDEGKVPMTIWLSHQEKQRLEDLALAWRRSPSEMIQEAFAKFHPVRPHSTDTVTDTSQLRALIQDMLATSPVVTDMVTDTLARSLPALVREIVEAMHPDMLQR